MSRGIGKIQQKTLLLLLGGAALGLSGSPKRYFKILREIAKEWKRIDQDHLKRAIRGLYESRLIKEKQNVDGTITIILTSDGKKKALVYDLDKIKIVTPK